MRVVLSVGIVFFAIYSTALAQQPVRWSYRAQHLQDGSFRILIHAKMTKGWHIYTVDQPKGAVSIPTSVTFKKNPLLRMEGELKSEGPVENDSYNDQVTFSQTVKVVANVKVQVVGEVNFMACDDHECLPPITLPFQLLLNPGSDNR